MKTTTLSKTAAIREARKYVSAVIRRSSTDYVFYGPYSLKDLDGATTEVQTSSREEAAALRAQDIARIALKLMGEYPADTVLRAEIEWRMEKALKKSGATIAALVDAARG